MSVDQFIPELWSARLLANLDAQTVLSQIVNRNYEGEIRNVGDTVHIQRPGNITVKPYPASGDITYEDPESTTRSLVVDQDEYYAFTVDDLDQVQANIPLVDTYTRRAAVSVAQAFDEHIASLRTGAGLTAVSVTLASDNYYEKMVAMGQHLDEANVPRIGRWHVTSPAGYAAVLKTDEFTHATNQGDSVIASAMVGQAAGFNIIVSNNLESLSGTSYGLYGTNDAITHARQLLGTPEALRLEGRFEDAVRGRIAYGSKVVEPNALGVVNLS